MLNQAKIDEMTEKYGFTYNLVDVGFAFNVIYNKQIIETPQTREIDDIFEISKSSDGKGNCPLEPFRILQRCLDGKRPDLEPRLWRIIRELVYNRSRNEQILVCEYDFEACNKGKINFAASLIIFLLNEWNPSFDQAFSVRVKSADGKQDLELEYTPATPGEITKIKTLNLFLDHQDKIHVCSGNITVDEIPETIVGQVVGKKLSDIIDCPYLPDVKITDGFNQTGYGKTVLVSPGHYVDILEMIDRHIT